VTDVVVFAGPSLAGARQRLPQGFTLKPPARQGDVFRTAEARPPAIGLIDGYFEGAASVWHKEILWALSLGIPVFGSASMGALRAAELHSFGMIGIGGIFEDYRSGRIEADDEVALLHGPEETGFVPLTEPLVNVRATCRAAALAGILPGRHSEAVVAAARSIFYKDRRWQRILDLTSEGPLSDWDRERFRRWLPGGRIDQKQQDALAMLDAMAEFLAQRTAVPVRPQFTSTFLWERAVGAWTQSSAAPGGAAKRRLPPRETLAGLLGQEHISSSSGRDGPGG
jgi:hypothetical protein